MTKCAECGSEKTIHMHHISYEPEETVPLCASCHKLVHENPDHELYPDDMENYDKSPLITMHEQVYQATVDVAEERGISYKEAVRDIFQEAGYDV